MANYSNLKTAIENAVDWNNGDNEITGQNLLDILETIIDSLGAKYKFADVATPSSSITTPDEPMFYLAGAGTYTNFGGLSVTIPRGTLAIFYYDTAWHYTTVRTDSDALFNVNQYLGAPSTTYTKANGRNAVPSALRSKGMIITYLTTNGWLIEQNLSTSGTWNADANWQTIGPVSVSQNTQTGGYILNIGGVEYNVASQQDCSKLMNAVINQSNKVVQNSELSHYSISEYQEGYINPDTGQNSTLSYNHIRTESILIAKEDIYLAITPNIKGRIYYYSGFVLNTFIQSIELISGVTYYIPVGTYYRLAFCYVDDSAPDISDIINNNVNLYQYSEPDINKLRSVTTRKFDSSIFQLGSISTATGQNGNNQKYIRTTGLETAKDNFVISVPDNVRGYIYYFNEFSYASFRDYAEIKPNSLTYVGKGTYYRLAFCYNPDEVNLPNPTVATLVSLIDITYSFLDKIDSLDVNADGSLWYVRDVAIATGEIVTSNKRILSRNIKRSELSIYATGGYRVAVYVYDNGTYLGCLNENNVFSTDTIKWWQKVELSQLSNQHPQYQFTIVACRATSDGTPIEDVMTTAESDCIKMMTPFGMKLFEKETFCPLVSFIDDDVPEEALDNWYWLANETGIRIGFAVPTAEPSPALWERLKRMQSAGFDFLSHTHHHINLMNETDPDVIRADLQASVDAFIEHGIKANALVYPQSSISPMSLGIVKQYFEYSFNGERGLASIQGNPLRQHNITRTDTLESGLIPYTDPDTGITYQVHAMLPLSELKSYVDKAVRENCWVIFETHFRNSATVGEGNDGFIYTPEMQQATLELIKYAISVGCRVVTPSEGYSILKNRYMRGVYASANYHIVDHNGFVYRRNM